MSAITAVNLLYYLFIFLLFPWTRERSVRYLLKQQDQFIAFTNSRDKKRMRLIRQFSNVSLRHPASEWNLIYICVKFLGSSSIWRRAIVLVHRRTRRPSHCSFSVWKFILALFEWKGGARFPGYFKQLKKLVHNFCIIESELIFHANT